jgi:hypothetical protein
MALVGAVHRIEQRELGGTQLISQPGALFRAHPSEDVSHGLPDLGLPPAGHA